MRNFILLKFCQETHIGYQQFQMRQDKYGWVWEGCQALWLSRSPGPCFQQEFAIPHMSPILHTDLSSIHHDCSNRVCSQWPCWRRKCPIKNICMKMKFISQRNIVLSASPPTCLYCPCQSFLYDCHNHFNVAWNNPGHSDNWDNMQIRLNNHILQLYIEQTRIHQKI